MTNTLSTLFQDIANAIRSKNGDTDKMKPIDFPEAILSIEGGGGSGGTGHLIPLTVTENGTYYPPKGTVEVGGTYTFKTAYTQEELKRVFDSGDIADDGVYSYLYRDDVLDNMLGIMYNAPYYGVYTSAEGLIWLPEAFTSQLGASEGWYQVTGDGGFAPYGETPIFTFNRTGESFIADLSITDDLFVLPEAADGFSSVEVNVSSGALDGTATVTFLDYDETELFSRPVFIGDDCESPVSRGQIATPTRATDVQYSYTFSGWASTKTGSASTTILNDITADKTVYAAYSKKAVLYTVNWYNEGTLVKTQQVAYNTTVTHPEVEKSGYVLTGWEPSSNIIKGNTDFYAQWEVDLGYAVKMADIATADAPNGACYAVSYNPESTRLLACSHNTAYIYNAMVEPYSLMNSFVFDENSANKTTYYDGNYTFGTYFNNGNNYVLFHKYRADTSTSKYAQIRALIYDSITGEQVSSNLYNIESTGTANSSVNISDGAISPNETTIALIVYFEKKPQLHIYSLNANTMSLRYRINMAEALGFEDCRVSESSVAFSSDSSTLYVTGQDMTSPTSHVKAIDLETLEDITTTVFDSTALGCFTSYTGTTTNDAVNATATCGNNNTLAITVRTTNAISEYLLFDTSTVPYTLKVRKEIVNKSSMTSAYLPTWTKLNPNGSVFVSDGIEMYGKLGFYDSTTFKVETVSDKPSNTVYGVTYSANGDRFACGFANKAPYLFVYKTQVK